MAPPYRALVPGEHDGNAPHQTRFTQLRHAGHPAVSLRSSTGATVLPVNPLTTFVRSLGNHGALTNARTVLDARRHEDWLVQRLTHRLESTGLDAPAAEPAAGRSTAA